MPGVNELLGGRWRLDEHAQPANLELTLITLHRAGGNRRAADSMEAIAAGNKVAVDFRGLAIMCECHTRLIRGDVQELHILRFKNNFSSSLVSRVNQIAQHLMLGVDGDRSAAYEVVEINAVRLSVEAELNAMMHLAFVREPLANATGFQQIDRRLLEHAGPHGGLHCRPRTSFQHDRIDAALLQQVRKQQPRRSGADNGDLRV
jgi:hypothetical protein